MIRSMTAYANRDLATGQSQLSWEIRSVNQRYLDVSIRLPDDFRAMEPDVRTRFKNRLSRGKVEANLKFQADPAAAAGEVQLNEALGRALLNCHQRLGVIAGNYREPDLVTLMQWPGLVLEQRPDFDRQRDQALELLDQAIEDLIGNREQEGQAIAGMLTARLAGIEEQVRLVRVHLPTIRASLKKRFEERLAGLGEDLEPGRLEQETALQLNKMDVEEELDRLDAHIAEVRRVLDMDEPVGRRLDFLMQEFNREANTLGSKATVAETTQAAVELKVLIEQMREQVQNVE